MSSLVQIFKRSYKVYKIRKYKETAEYLISVTPSSLSDLLHTPSVQKDPKVGNKYESAVVQYLEDTYDLMHNIKFKNSAKSTEEAIKKTILTTENAIFDPDFDETYQKYYIYLRRGEADLYIHDLKAILEVKSYPVLHHNKLKRKLKRGFNIYYWTLDDLKTIYNYSYKTLKPIFQSFLYYLQFKNILNVQYFGILAPKIFATNKFTNTEYIILFDPEETQQFLKAVIAEKLYLPIKFKKVFEKIYDAKTWKG